MVKHTIRWSEQSKTDLKGIFEYIKQSESRERANYVIANLRNAANEIAYFPAKHAQEPTILDTVVRYTIKWNYKILFTTNEKYVNIIRIFHTAQNPIKINHYN
jgi:plasmid stabilization system protein ParE